MGLIDIYVSYDHRKGSVLVKCQAVVVARRKVHVTVWKCGKCQRGNVATCSQVDWGDLDIKRKCAVCKRKVRS